MWEKEWLPTDFAVRVCDIYVCRFNNNYEQILRFLVCYIPDTLTRFVLFLSLPCRRLPIQ